MSMFTKAKAGRYITIIGDGKFHETVPQGTEDAVLREFETSDGKKGTKLELVYSKITANITDIGFYDSDFGVNIKIGLQGEEGEVELSINTESSFAEDLMKKLPNIDFSKPVELSPYAFTDDSGRNKRGMTVIQEGKKLGNYFYDPETNANCHGFPTVENKEDMNKAKWKIYFIQAREFLIDYTKEKVIPKLSIATREVRKSTHNENSKEHYPTEEINPEDIPF